MNTADTFKHLLLQSGTSWVLWFLSALSLASLAIAIERWWACRARECDPQALAAALGARLAERDYEAAIEELGRSRSFAAAIASAGLQLAGHGPAAADRAMQSAVALERGRLDRRLAYLGTLGNNAPFIGLFGTVIGVIGAFEELGRAGAGGAGQIASQAVMTAIAEALVATAVGILVALPAVAAFNHFQRRIARLLAQSEVLSNLVLAYLSSERRSA